MSHDVEHSADAAPVSNSERKREAAQKYNQARQRPIIIACPTCNYSFPVSIDSGTYTKKGRFLTCPKCDKGVFLSRIIREAQKATA